MAETVVKIPAAKFEEFLTKFSSFLESEYPEQMGVNVPTNITASDRKKEAEDNKLFHRISGIINNFTASINKLDKTLKRLPNMPTTQNGTNNQSVINNIQNITNNTKSITENTEVVWEESATGFAAINKHLEASNNLLSMIQKATLPQETNKPPIENKKGDAQNKAIGKMFSTASGKLSKIQSGVTESNTHLKRLNKQLIDDSKQQENAPKDNEKMQLGIFQRFKKLLNNMFYNQSQEDAKNNKQNKKDDKERGKFLRIAFSSLEKVLSVIKKTLVDARLLMFLSLLKGKFGSLLKMLSPLGKILLKIPGVGLAMGLGGKLLGKMGFGAEGAAIASRGISGIIGRGFLTLFRGLFIAGGPIGLAVRAGLALFYMEFKNQLDGLFGEIIKFLGDPERIKNVLAEMGNKLWSMYDSLKGSVGSIMDKITDTMHDVINKIMRFFASIGPSMEVWMLSAKKSVFEFMQSMIPDWAPESAKETLRNTFAMAPEEEKQLLNAQNNLANIQHRDYAAEEQKWILGKLQGVGNAIEAGGLDYFEQAKGLYNEWDTSIGNNINHAAEYVNRLGRTGDIAKSSTALTEQDRKYRTQSDMPPLNNQSINQTINNAFTTKPIQPSTDGGVGIRKPTL